MNIKEYLQQNDFSRWLVNNEQGRIEIKILPYLQDIENGFFVEAGALDGLFMSNTKILEDCGWTGLLIEPSKKACAKCRQNRTSPVENCALVSNDFKGDIAYGDFWFDGDEGLGAWSGINKNPYGVKAVASVFATPLDKLLKYHKINKIDFLSLDVEGYELEALKGIDLSTTDITYILVEVNLKDYTLEQMDAYLKPFGYKNLGCLSGFTKDMEGWDGSHNDYLYGKSC